MPVPTINPLGNMFQAVPRMMPINLRMMRPVYICFGIWIDVCIVLVALYSVNELQNYVVIVIQIRAPTVLYRLKFGGPADVLRSFHITGGCYPAGPLDPVDRKSTRLNSSHVLS